MKNAASCVGGPTTQVPLIGVVVPATRSHRVSTQLLSAVAGSTPGAQLATGPYGSAFGPSMQVVFRYPGAGPTDTPGPVVQVFGSTRRLEPLGRTSRSSQRTTNGIGVQSPTCGTPISSSPILASVWYWCR